MKISKFCLQMAIASTLGLAIVPAAHADKPEIGFVADLTLGDTACYVELIDLDGNSAPELASFEICEQDLIGESVVLTYGYADVLAESCQGDPECSETEEVMLIIQADILDESLTEEPVDYPPFGTVQDMVSGDRACYVDLIDEAGNDSTQFARFEICEQDLIGESVVLTYDYADIMAESCQGDPECSETEEVALITQADILDESESLTEETDDYPTLGTVQDMVSGDRACYVDLIDEAGNDSTQFASFEICEQDLVGESVVLTYDYADIIAESCQGNPECGESETVMLIIDAIVLE